MSDGRFMYLALSGVCNNVRGDSAYRITTVTGDNVAITSTTIRNQFTTLPLCFAFIVNSVVSESTLIYAGPEGNALITIGSNSIEFSLGGNSVMFTTLNLVGGTEAQRVQICTDGINAMLYEDCTLLEEIAFPIDSIPPTTSVTVLVNNSMAFDVSNAIKLVLPD